MRGDALARGTNIRDDEIVATQQNLTQVMPLLRLFELEVACADLQRALANRPDWVGVPLRRLAALAG